MKYVILLLCLITFGEMHTKRRTVIERTYTIELSGSTPEDTEKPPLVFNFNQECTVENSQKNACTHPVVKAPDEPVKAPVASSWLSPSNLFTPLNMGLSGCLVATLYLLKTRFSLYSLSKACIENAIWSLWQTKTNSPGGIHKDMDLELLHDILSTYETDQYAVAIARFLQDSDREMKYLTSYLKQAKHASSSMLSFLLPDLTEEIVTIESRLTHLARLKQRVLLWLATANEQF